MRLVDREQRDRAARLPQGSHQRAEPLGRAVQQPNAPVERRIEDGASLGGGEQAVQIGRGDSAAPQPAHLILHQRDEGRDDECQTLGHERG